MDEMPVRKLMKALLAELSRVEKKLFFTDIIYSQWLKDKFTLAVQLIAASSSLPTQKLTVK